MASNIPTVHALYAAFGAGDIAGILSHLAEDVVWEYEWGVTPPSLYQERHGRSEVPGFFEALSAYEFLNFEPQNFLEGGNQVAVPIRFEVRSKATGRSLREFEIHLWTFGADGKVSAMRHVLDPRGFEQIG